MTELGTNSISFFKEALPKKYINDKVSLLFSSIDKRPDVAIGTAKELVENTLKNTLHEHNIVYFQTDDIPHLYGFVSTKLKLNKNTRW